MTSENEDKGIDDGHRTLLRLCLPQRKKCLVCSKLKQVSKICSANNFAAAFSIEMQFFLSVNYGQARRYLYASEMVSLINPNSTYFLALLAPSCLLLSNCPCRTLIKARFPQLLNRARAAVTYLPLPTSSSTCLQASCSISVLV